MNTSIYSIIGVTFASILSAIGAYYLKLGSNKLRFNLWKIIKNKPLIKGIFAYGFSTLIFIPSLKFGELSVLYPLFSTTYIWVILISIKKLNEKMNLYRYTGIFLIILGVILIGLGS